MTSNVINGAVYAELQAAAGEDFVTGLVAAFLEEAPGMFEDLRAALSGGDTDGFRRAAHSIKSNADIFGAQDLAASARALELMEVSGPTPELETHMAGLQAEFQRASDALQGLQHG